MAVGLLLRLKIIFKSTTFDPLQENGQISHFLDKIFNGFEALKP